MKKCVFTCAAILCLGFVACEKSNDEEKDTTAAKTTLITTGTWKFSSAGIDNNNDGTKDQDIPAAFILTCETDNIVTFKTDKSGVMDEGATKCATTDPQTVNFTWDFTNNANNITVSAGLFPGLDGEAKIIELSSTKLTVSKNVTVMGITVNAIVFFVH
jgi:hypothetical protein